MDVKIGVVPLPLAAAIGLIVLALLNGKNFPSDILINLAVLSLGGFLCADVGRRLPLASKIGAGAIFATFIPSYLVYAHLLPAPVANSITTFTKSSNFLYLFISAVVVGSILGMDRRVLITGFLKIFVPLGCGSIVAAAVGCGVGAAFGLAPRDALFRIVVPIMAGGVGEGALPLSIGYAAITHQAQGEVFASILPTVMFASLTAIILSGGLNLLGKRFPGLTGEGRLQIGEHDVAVSAESGAGTPADLETVAGAAIMAVTLYLAGLVAQKLTGLPAPVAMLLLTVVIKLLRLVPPELEQGAYTVYRFFRVAVTYPLLFAIGVSMTPWESLMAAVNGPTLVTILATVVALMGTGFIVARRIGMYPIEVAIVNACHSGQGGTGDVAILTAANRMQLMPFAQIATRIFGAATVTLALVALKMFGP